MDFEKVQLLAFDLSQVATCAPMRRLREIQAMRPSGTLDVAPERVALSQQIDAWPLPPSSWEVLTDARWAALQRQFELPDIAGGVNIRAFWESYCRALIDCRKERSVQDHCKLDDEVIRWMSKASNIGKSYDGAISEGVVYRLSCIAEMLHRADARIVVSPNEFKRVGVLTIPAQLCAAVCRDLAPQARVHRCTPPIIEFYAALWRSWEEFLGRDVRRWAHEGGLGASDFVRLLTHLLRMSKEHLPHDDAMAWKNVRARLDYFRTSHAQLLSAPGSATQANIDRADASSTAEWRRCFYRRTEKSGFLRRRRSSQRKR